MKKIEVNSKCNGCGLCIMNCVYLEEDDEGNARPVAGMMVKNDDLKAVEKVIAECPEHALQIVETGTKKSGIEGVKEVIDDLEKNLKKIEIDKNPNIPTINVKEFELSAPSSDKAYKKVYTSESSAKSAARDEFRRLCYSENAYKPMLKKVFVEYKVRTLKPYYDCEDEPDSAYYKYNNIVRKYLADAYAEICNLMGEGVVPIEWKNFSCYLIGNEWEIKELEKFEESISDDTIMDVFKEKMIHNSLEDYVSHMDFDYDEVYAGKGLFGNTKYKEKWWFGGFYDAACEFIDDLKWSIDYNYDVISERAERSVKCALDKFEERIQKEIANKIEELRRYVKLDA